MGNLEVRVSQSPQAPCNKCLADPVYCQGKEGIFLWCWCQHNEAGAVRFWYKGKPWAWRSFSPVPWETFVQYLSGLAGSFGELKQRELNKGEEAIRHCRSYALEVERRMLNN